MLDCSIIEIGCECGHNQKIDRDFQKKIFGGEVKISDLTNFYKKFKCTKCDKKNPDVFDSNKNQLFDKSNLIECETCKGFISIPRQKAKEGTTFCTPMCEFGLPPSTPEERALEQKKRKEFIQKNDALGRYHDLQRRLESKMYTMVDAINEFKEKTISKSEYETKFKRFTWWIKTEIEKEGGKLIDNPTRYIDCPDCGHLTLVIWSPKNQRYFLGCSEFHNGCAWAKSIWKY
ncbi:hypothetical protein N9U95_00800 [Candidatus Pelagibacter sp.]|nr:hypothetical protein [Candidatus Pelagibacter sp.]